MKNPIIHIILIYAIAIAVLLIPGHSRAGFDYDISWFSTNSKVSILSITIDDCVSRFEVKNEDMEKFSKDSKSLKEVIEKSLYRAKIGCPAE